MTSKFELSSLLILDFTKSIHLPNFGNIHSLNVLRGVNLKETVGSGRRADAAGSVARANCKDFNIIASIVSHFKFREPVMPRSS
jgi:hypothetical protein